MGPMGVAKASPLRQKYSVIAAAPSHVAGVRAVFVDAVDPADYEAVGRAMAAVARVGH